MRPTAELSDSIDIERFAIIGFRGFNAVFAISPPFSRTVSSPAAEDDARKYPEQRALDGLDGNEAGEEFRERAR